MNKGVMRLLKSFAFSYDREEATVIGEIVDT
jgi:hypothetical protein